MKNLLLIFIIMSLLTQAAYAALQAGVPAPDFQLQASLAGKEFSFSLKEALAKGPVVVYFYPSAYTGGCNAEAHEFSVNHDKFVAAGASVIGVSLDSIKRLNDFSSDPNYCAGKVTVASDVEGKTAKSYELKVRDAAAGKKDTRGIEIDHGFAERTTFIVTSDGRIAATLTDFSPAENVAKSLEVVQHLTAVKK
jgi:peroxiredoxin